ncbi:MAG TPA: SGNH/GDSL hydrolase family protein [Acidimicrobiales bacterium]|jgi:lysophospholipase L1-like esterase|nr:SGNH/GDSL hydrolase family protein [Acidimicrobiales bacterium]
MAKTSTRATIRRADAPDRVSRRTILAGTGLTLAAAAAPTILAPTTASAQTVSASPLTAVSGELTAFRAALANRFFSRCNVAVVGDSISEGQGATSVAYRSVNRLADSLRLRFPVPGVTGGQGFLPAQFVSPSLPAPAAVTGSPALNMVFGPGWRCRQISGSQSYTFTVTATSVDVVYAAGPSAGTMGVTIDNGPLQTIATTRASLADGALAHFAISGSGQHTITITAVSGTVFLDGIVVYNGDEASGITVHDCSHYGMTLRQWAQSSPAITSSWLGALSPSLIIFELGVNDYHWQEALTTFTADLATMSSIFNNLPTNPSVLVLVDYDAFNMTGLLWPTYVAAYQTWAATNGYAFLDLTQRMPPTNAAKSFGLYASDSVHPSNAGHSFVADAITGLLTAS